jgi:hypothetical protein
MKNLKNTDRWNAAHYNKTQMLEQCCFVNIDAQTQANESIFKNQKELSDWLIGWVPHATGLPEDKAQKFVSDVMQNAKKAP